MGLSEAKRNCGHDSPSKQAIESFDLEKLVAS